MYSKFRVRCNWLWCFGDAAIQSQSPQKRPLILCLYVFFVVGLNKLLKPQSSCWCWKTSSCVILYIFSFKFKVHTQILKFLRQINHDYNLIKIRYDGTFYLQVCWEDLPGRTYICLLLNKWGGGGGGGIRNDYTINKNTINEGKNLYWHGCPDVNIYQSQRNGTSLTHLPPSAAYMRHWTVSSLVQIMACRLFGVQQEPNFKAFCPCSDMHKSFRKPWWTSITLSVQSVPWTQWPPFHHTLIYAGG